MCPCAGEARYDTYEPTQFQHINIIWRGANSGNGTTGTEASFSLKNWILLHDKYKPVLYIYMLQRIEIPPTPMTAVAMTVNTAAGNPILIPFGPSQSAGTVRRTDTGGTVTFTEARQAVAYAGVEVSGVKPHGHGGIYVPPSTGVDPALGSGIFSFFLISWAYMPVISASFPEWNEDALSLYIAGNRGWQQRFDSCTGNCRPPHTPGSGQKGRGRVQYVLTWIAENAGAHAVAHCPKKVS